MKQILLVILIGLCSFVVKAQDTLRLLDGSEVVGKLYDVKGEMIDFLVWKRNKTEGRLFYKAEIYSIKRETGGEFILYKPSIDIKHLQLEVPEMKVFMKGMDAANKYYKSPMPFIFSFAASSVGGYFLAKETNPVFIPLAPAAYLLLSSITRPHFKKNMPYSVETYKNENFKNGYINRAKRKKFEKVAYGALSGFAATVGTLLIMDATQ